MNAITRLHRTGMTIGWIAAGIITELPAQAAPSPREPRLTGTTFAEARYKTGSSASLYAAHHFGAAMIVAGVVHQPRNNQQTLVLGTGTRIRLTRAAKVTVILAGATAPSGTSLRLYALPRLTAGRVTVSGIAAAYQPLGGRLVQQAMVDPLTVSVPVIPGVRVGLAAMIATAEGKPPEFGVGPSTRLRIPGGALTFELVARNRQPPQLRSAFSAAL